MKNIINFVFAFFILHSAFVFAGPIEIPADAGPRLAALEAGTAIPEITVNNETVRTNLTVNGVINGPFTIGTTNLATGTLPGGVKASATNLNGNVPATQIAAGDLAGSVRASGTNLNGTVPLGSIARTTGWTNTIITAFAFNGSNEVVMTTKTLSYDGLVIAEGAGVIVTNTY